MTGTLPRPVPGPPTINLRPNGIEVMRWPPGQGKSTGVRQEIADAMQRGDVRRVLWAVNSTVGDHSLGREAQAHFRSLGVKASLVLGADHLTESGQYWQQLRWRHTPEVKIVSYAHLPLLYDRLPRYAALAQQAELLVIDELPLSALTHTTELLFTDVLQVPHQGRILSQLRAVLGRCVVPFAPATIDKHTSVFRNERQKYLTGRDLLEAMGNEWSEQDWHELRDQLADTFDKRKQGIFLDEWVAALREDLADPARNSYRFRVAWKVRETWNGSKFKITQPALHANIRTPLRGLPSTLILDAYAEPHLYDALFPEYTQLDQLRIVTAGEPARLRVELAPMLRVYPTHADSMSAKYLQVAEEIIQLHMQHPVTVLATKEMIAEGSPWNTQLRKAAQLAGCDHLPAQIYYHAGRGVNHHAGNTVVAIMPPHLPLIHREGALAALYPHSPADREKAHELLLRAEYLQMLHRGRQPRTGARIIAANMGKLLRADCETVPYQPLLQFTRKSSRPRTRDAIKTVSEEMLQHFGGLPQALLGVLKLIPVEFSPENEKGHATVLRAALSTLNLDDTTELGHWYAQGTLRRFQDVAGFKGKETPLKEVMATLGLTPAPKLYARTVESWRLRTRLWVPPGTDAQAVFDRIYGAVVGSA